jgi:hypothetical protein
MHFWKTSALGFPECSRPHRYRIANSTGVTILVSRSTKKTEESISNYVLMVS